MRLEALEVVSVEIMVFWNVSQCGLIDRYQCSGGLFRKIEAEGSF
jgi:hypothetical protein